MSDLEENFEEPSREVVEVSDEMLAGFMERLSGKDSFGEAKAAISYQNFAIEEEDDSFNKKTIYNIAKATASISRSKKHPDYMKVDITFGSYDDTELKLMWGRLKRMDALERQEPDKTWIYHINMVEIASTKDGDDGVLIGHFLNPAMSYLTRETPTTLSDEKNIDGELVGGNVIRMLVPISLCSFEVNRGINLDEINAEIQREEMDRDYIDSYEESSFSSF